MQRSMLIRSNSHALRSALRRDRLAGLDAQESRAIVRPLQVTRDNEEKESDAAAWRFLGYFSRRAHGGVR